MFNIERIPIADVACRHGPACQANGSADFGIWAPVHARMRLEIAGHPNLYPMKAASEGWHQACVWKLRSGARYAFVLPDGTRVPDPASHFQPDGVEGYSELIDPTSYRWRDEGWVGRPWHSTVLYELHVGAFTKAGTFLGAIERLDHLVSLGVTAIELMPIGAFPGRRNWGYDVIFPYACDRSYGRPEDFKLLIDEAHARGLMVLLDVVYNHFGPKGNLLSLYAPEFFTERHHIPWGAGINFDGPNGGAVRDFFIGSAIRWIDEFHLDGLRIDAAHTIKDGSDRHFLDELADRVRACAPTRIVHLLLENEENQASRLIREEGGKPVSFTAQWNDDVHHVLHAAVTGETESYYRDYAGDTEKLGRALAEGFAFQGEVMRFRGSARGEASWYLPPDAFVAFIQNHDQIGNRARGERLGLLVADEARRAAAAVYLLLPQIPMLFMGEEWNSRQPFPFFCDFEGELGGAVRQGRYTEFSHSPEFRDPQQRHRIPDPLSEHTFSSAVLDWEAAQTGEGRDCLEWYRQLLAVRRLEIVPRLMRFTGGDGRYCALAPGAVTVDWTCKDGALLRLNANMTGRRSDHFPGSTGREIWLEGRRDVDGVFDPWTVQWAIVNS
jgi:malto-oligosyltrehalose trehalohydrolase